MHVNDSIPFEPLEPVEGYLPIKDHGLIGDGSTAALVARDGAVAWLCVPRFDSPPLFCSILDQERGGAFRIQVEGLREARQYYEPDTAILVTELKTDQGILHITDMLTFRSGSDLNEGIAVDRGEILRIVHAREGTIRFSIAVEPRGGARTMVRAGGIRIKPRDRELDLQLWSSVPLSEGTHSEYALEAGDGIDFILSWRQGTHRPRPADPQDLVDATRSAWQRWIQCFHYEGRHEWLVRRSAITLKLLDHMENGAIVAAPTSSLPECVGGVRNWDYRYAWIRDAAFSVYALRRIGMTVEAADFLTWVLELVEEGERPSVLYRLDGLPPPSEWEDPHLSGYRHSSPVRWGNGAADQVQHDVFGEMLDVAYQWAQGGEQLDERVWKALRVFINKAQEAWRTPDHGIWEVRSPGEVFTYSAAMCQVALDRGSRIAEAYGLPGDVEGWRTSARRIRDLILDEAWDERQQAIAQRIGGGPLDASTLALPLRRVIRADDPRMVKSTDAIARHLGAGKGLIYRYDPEEAPDGLPGKEGAFLLCSFWLVDNLAMQGRLDEAIEIHESLCGLAGPLGLLPEQIDPGTGRFLGNYPQAFSHVGLISTSLNLERHCREREKG